MRYSGANRMRVFKDPFWQKRKNEKTERRNPLEFTETHSVGVEPKCPEFFSPLE